MLTLSLSICFEIDTNQSYNIKSIFQQQKTCARSRRHRNETREKMHIHLSADHNSTPRYMHTSMVFIYACYRPFVFFPFMHACMRATVQHPFPIGIWHQITHPESALTRMRLFSLRLVLLRIVLRANSLVEHHYRIWSTVTWQMYPGCVSIVICPSSTMLHANIVTLIIMNISCHSFQ